MASLQGHMTTNANSITQKAAVAALLGPTDFIEYMRTEFDKRRKYLVNRLRNMEGITCAEAKGAFYLMPNVSKLFGKKYKGKVLKDSFDVAGFLLEEAHIAIVPGAAFEAPDNVRISYSNSLENIKEGMDRMERALGVLK
jgi:aspartate aminotransferase